MLPDWMGGGSPTTEKKPKPRSSAGSAASVGASAVPAKIPDWAKDSASSGSGTKPSPTLEALQKATQPQINTGMSNLADNLGIFTGALAPAAEVAAKEEPEKADAWDKMFAKPDMKEGLKPRQVEGKMKTRELTREDYLGLPKEVRAAIDFNTMLVNARKMDRANLRSGDAPGVERKVNLGTTTMPNGMPMQTSPQTTVETLPADYAEVFASVFGEAPRRTVSVGIGPDAQPVESEKLPPVRPEVLSVLKQIGYKTDSPSEMNDFLALRNGISQSDIDNYLMDNDEPAVPSLIPGAGPLKSEREVFVEKIADLTLELQDKLSQGDKLIADFQTSALKAREPERLFLGADVQPTELPEGFGDRKVDKMFQETFEYLLQQPNKAELQNQLANFNSFLGSQGLNPDDFLSFAQTKLDNADLGQPLGAGIKVGTKDQKFQYRTPEEYRTLFGLTKEE